MLAGLPDSTVIFGELKRSVPCFWERARTTAETSNSPTNPVMLAKALAVAPSATVPGMFGGLLVVRDPGCNVASWNLSRRRLAFGPGGALTVNGSPLKFYHFTKIGGVEIGRAHV